MSIFIGVITITRLEPSEKIPADLREIYAHLAGGLIDALGVLHDLRTLYSTSEEAIELMNKTAATFFVRHERLLIHHIILFVSRATDEKQSGSRKKPQENLTLARLLDLPTPEQHDLRIDLHKKLTVIKADAKPMQLYRHKLLGHASLKHHLLPSTNLGGNITLKSMSDLLDNIGDYLATFDQFFTGVDAQFYYPLNDGEADDLLAYLKLAVEAEAKENEQRLKAAGLLNNSTD